MEILKRTLYPSELASDLETALSRLGVGVGEEFAVEKVKQTDPSKNALGGFRTETSRQAALDNYPRSGSQRWRVLQYIAAAATPRSREEIADWLMLPLQSVNPRCHELIQGGFIRDAGLTRKTAHGSKAGLLELTDKGAEEVARHELSAPLTP